MWSFDGCVGEGATSSLPAGGRVEKTISTPLCGEGVKEHIENGHPDSLTAHPDRPPTTRTTPRQPDRQADSGRDSQRGQHTRPPPAHLAIEILCLTNWKKPYIIVCVG